MCSTSFSLCLMHIANLLTETSVCCTYYLGLMESVGEFSLVQKSHYPCWGLCLAFFWSLPLLGITVGLLFSWICSMLFHGCTFHWAHLSWFPFDAYDEYILRITQFLHLQLLHNEVILWFFFWTCTWWWMMWYICMSWLADLFNWASWVCGSCRSCEVKHHDCHHWFNASSLSRLDGFV